MLGAAFAVRVEELRAQKGITQDKLARAVGVTESWLWRIQAKPRKITLALVMRITTGLDVTPDELLKGLPVPTTHRTRSRPR